MTGPASGSGTASRRRIAVIGLGVMGLPMATNLVAAGYDVVGFNRSEGKRRRFEALGGRAADRLGDALDGAEVVITVLPDAPDVEAVVHAPDGVLGTAGEGRVLIDMSTIAPSRAVALAEACAAGGVSMLDAPVSGGEEGAKAGTLAIMVGGDATTLEAVRDVLEVLGGKIAHVGPSGAGQLVKAANQLVVAGNIAVLAEAVVLLERGEVDLSAALGVLGGGLAGSRVLDNKAERMLTDQFEPGFRLSLHHKDMGIALDVARQLGAVVPLGALVAQEVASAVGRGDGGLDHAALVKLARLLAGASGPS